MTHPQSDARHTPGADDDVADTEALVALVHSDLSVPHTRLRVVSLHHMRTGSGGVAYTATVFLDGTLVGSIANDGNGGASVFHCHRPYVFGGRHLERFVTRCRRRGRPVPEEQVLDCLVDEFDIGREVDRAAAAGVVLARLLNSDGWCLTIRTVGSTEPAHLAQLAQEPATVPGTMWQIWTDGRWRAVAFFSDLPPVRQAAVDLEGQPRQHPPR